MHTVNHEMTVEHYIIRNLLFAFVKFLRYCNRFYNLPRFKNEIMVTMTVFDRGNCGKIIPLFSDQNVYVNQ